MTWKKVVSVTITREEGFQDKSGLGREHQIGGFHQMSIGRLLLL